MSRRRSVVGADPFSGGERPFRRSPRDKAAGARRADGPDRGKCPSRCPRNRARALLLDLELASGTMLDAEEAHVAPE